MTRDELEFSISQYIDGTLGARERDALEERLATDAEARAVHAEYASLQRVLKAAPAPEVDWDQFAAQISGAVAREEMPQQSYKISRWLRPARLAIAASVLVAAGLAFTLLKPGTKQGGVPDNLEPTRIVVVDPAPAGEANIVATAPVSQEPIRIVIGPSDNAANETVFVRYADTLVQRPSKALIVSAAPAGQDTPPTPF